MLTSPLRRCALTQLVLPKDLMIQFKLVKITSTGQSRLILSPSSILHPRFTEAVAGKGVWLTCSKSALDAWSSKGSFKRISARATLPSFTAQQVHSQLARRLLQEAELLAVRLKSASRQLPSGAMRPCPIVLHHEGDKVGSAQSAGQRTMALLNFGEIEPDAVASTSIFSSRDKDVTPINMSHLVGKIVTPDSESSLESSTQGAITVEESIRLHLEDVIKVYARRQETATGQTSQIDTKASMQLEPAPLEHPSGTLYALVQPHDDLQGAAVADLFTPFLTAAHRLRLWSN